MLLKDKQAIEALRKENYSYACIAKTLGLSPNTVKSIYHRNGYVPKQEFKTKAEKSVLQICKNCGRILDCSNSHKKYFCCDACRIEWWKNARRKGK